MCDACDLLVTSNNSRSIRGHRLAWREESHSPVAKFIRSIYVQSCVDKKRGISKSVVTEEERASP